MKHHHIGIGVENLDRQIVFYRDVLGFEEETRFDIPEASLQIVVMRREDAGRVELLAASAQEGEESPARPGGKHLCFEVGDLEELTLALKREGVAIVQEIRVIEPAGVRNLWISDAEGNLIEFIQPI